MEMEGGVVGKMPVKKTRKLVVRLASPKDLESGIPTRFPSYEDEYWQRLSERISKSRQLV